MKTLSPGTSLIIVKVGNNYKVIGNATNLFIQTTRGKMPIYVFGKSTPQGIARGQQFIYGSIDMVQFGDKFNDLIQQQKTHITPVEKEITGVTGTAVAKSILGNSLSAQGYSVSTNELDTLKFNHLIFVSLDTQNANDKSSFSYLGFQLNDVEFTSYSYSKSINNVTQLERIEFM